MYSFLSRGKLSTNPDNDHPAKAPNKLDLITNSKTNIHFLHE